MGGDDERPRLRALGAMSALALQRNPDAEGLTMRCSACGREIERGNYVRGRVMCASCALVDEETAPQPKRIVSNWQAFSTAKRRNRRWR